MNDKDKEAFEKWFGLLGETHLERVIKLNRGASSMAWQAACLHKQKEIDELTYFKAIYNSLIDGAARDTEKINKLQAEIDELDNEDMLRNHMNSIGYRELKKLQAENANLKERIFMKSTLVDSLKAENAKLRECLSNWLSWEQKQINTHGEYCGEEIKKLISDARQILKELEEK